jgi:hypothetical protein
MTRRMSWSSNMCAARKQQHLPPLKPLKVAGGGGVLQRDAGVQPTCLPCHITHAPEKMF